MGGKIRREIEKGGVRRLSRIAGTVIFLGSFGAFPIGTAVGGLIMMGLFISGNRMATKYYCVSCGSPVDSKKVKVCPVCKISLE
jgi:hypothetical protein